MYPAFHAGVHHYAVRCENPTTIRVIARSQGDRARLTFLHSGRESIGSVDEEIVVNVHHDIAIQVTEDDAVQTYYVHCIPPDFPDITIERRTDEVTDGLLLITPSIRRTDNSFLAIVDKQWGAKVGAQAGRPRPQLPALSGWPLLVFRARQRRQLSRGDSRRRPREDRHGNSRPPPDL